MTHEGRMIRGEEKLKQGITDTETEYYLANKEDVKPPKTQTKKKEKKEVRENGES